MTRAEQSCTASLNSVNIFYICYLSPCPPTLLDGKKVKVGKLLRICVPEVSAHFVGASRNTAKWVVHTGCVLI